jgi:FKBP-type peptidyl-prolyl cis-trans isomerase
MLLNKGAKATIILPSKLAYGEQGNQGIPPYSPLVFELDIVNIIPGTAPVAAVAPQK